MDISGTSLADLQDANGGSMYQMPPAPPMYQQQMQPNYPSEAYQPYPKVQNVPDERYMRRNQYENIDNKLPYVVNEINDDISDLDDDELDKLISKNYDKESNRSNKKTKVPEMIRDPLTIVALYCILSMTIVKENIAKYVPQIEPGDDGQPRLSGIVIYGIILAILFVIVKNYILPRL